MVRAVACADVPKFTVIVGGSFGAGNYGMFLLLAMSVESQATLGRYGRPCLLTQVLVDVAGQFNRSRT